MPLHVLLLFEIEIRSDNKDLFWVTFWVSITFSLISTYLLITKSTWDIYQKLIVYGKQNRYINS